MEVEVADKHVAGGVDDKGGNEAGEEVAETGSWSRWAVDKGSFDSSSFIRRQLELHVFHGRGVVVWLA